MFKKLFGKPKQTNDVKPHGKTDAMSTIERLNEVRQPSVARAVQRGLY